MSAKPVYFPEEVMIIIKAYLLLPREVYEARLGWWNHYATIPYINLLETVFCHLQIEQTIYRTPILIPALPDTRSKALKKLYSIIDKNYNHVSKNGIKGIWHFRHDGRCQNSDCNDEYEEDDLVVKLLPYMDYKEMGVDPLQEQYVCKECVQNGIEGRYGMCGLCFGFFDWLELTYVETDEDTDYDNDYFCEDCVGRVDCEDEDCEN